MTTKKSITYIKREIELFSIFDRLNEWDQYSQGAIEDAHSVLKKNQASIDRIAELNNEMSSGELEDFWEINKNFIQGVFEKQKELISFIKKESNHLTKQLSQMNQKSNVVNHYMNKEKSLFIDRDM